MLKIGKWLILVYTFKKGMIIIIVYLKKGYQFQYKDCSTAEYQNMQMNAYKTQ